MRTDSKGYMTIEASVIIPVVIIGIFVCLFGLILIYERASVSAAEYRALYTIPLNSIRNKEVQAYLEAQDYTGTVVLGSASVESSASGSKASCEGQVCLFGSSSVSGSREIDVRVDRLRRWQFYGDTYEKYGD
ncbi:hypothetical protein SAMN02910369_00230 [Lachnospiraceae bacterium NE2001]|nr:hypothetical protein SAMN02910369_00230 [Lachnospiraceae bacterium NE2001]